MWQNNSDSLHPHLSKIRVQFSQLIDKKHGMRDLDAGQPKRSTRMRHEGTSLWWPRTANKKFAYFCGINFSFTEK